ncbi:Slp family lipoprotein [Nitrospira sp. MA-1]|nr:Slp family lipoprotein [Nitrospira sp. MA-1]
MKLKTLIECVFLGLGCVMGGCAASPMEIPETLRNQIDPTLTFLQVIQHPGSYQGKILLLGGEVLSVKRLKEGTRLEVLQLPLDEYRRPLMTRTDSQGRFLAMEKTFLDPAMFPPHTLITLVGEVTESVAGKLDEMDYQFPAVVIKDLYVWKDPSLTQASNSGPWSSIFGGGSTGGRVGGGIGVGIGF